MNPLERFHATLDRKPVDHSASWLGIPTNEAILPDIDPANIRAMFETVRE